MPVVLAQNALRWEPPHQFSALFDLPPELADEASTLVPDFTFQLVQLADLPFEKIVGTPAGILVLRTLKAEQIEKLLGAEVWDESLIKNALPTFEMVLRYILSQTEIDKVAFAGKVAAIQSLEIKDIAMTLAQQFRQEGRQEGRVVILQESIIDALILRFGDVPQGMRETILGVREETALRTLLRAAIQAASLEDFSRSL